jgi:hypothetical protein
MRHVGGSDVTFVPITIGTGGWTHLLDLGTIARVVEKIAPEALIIASTI